VLCADEWISVTLVMEFDLMIRVFYWSNNPCILNMPKPGPQWIRNVIVACTGKACLWYLKLSCDQVISSWYERIN